MAVAEKYQGNPLKHSGKHFDRLLGLLTAYAKREGLHHGPKADQDWDYEHAAADIIADLMHVCDRMKVDSQNAVRHGEIHYTVETSEECPCGAAYDPESTPEFCQVCKGSMDLVSCAKCGGRVLRESAIEDEGEGDEAGRTFHYCSEHCRETH